MEVEYTPKVTAFALESPKRTRKGKKKRKRSTKKKKAGEPIADVESPHLEDKFQPVTMYTSVAESDATIGKRACTTSGTDDDRPRKTLIYGDVTMFLFFRLHRFIYERLSIAKKLCSMSRKTPPDRTKYLHGEENADDNLRDKDAEGEDAEAEETTKTESGEEEQSDFTHFLSTLHAVVDGTCDNSRFEDHCRNLMGPGSYHLHNIDKLIAQTVKMMVSFATDHTSKRMRSLFDYECRRKTPSPSLYASDCAALIRNEVAGGHTPKLEMFCFCMKEGIPARTTNEVIKRHQADNNANELLNLEALGIAPCSSAPKNRFNKLSTPKVSHGWRVAPSLAVGYVPMKKGTVVNLTGLDVNKASEISEYVQ